MDNSHRTNNCIVQPSAAKRLRVELREDDENEISTMPLPVELRVRALQFLDQEGLGNFACVSRRCRKDTEDSSLPQSRVAVLHGNCHREAPFMPAWNPFTYKLNNTFLGVLQAIQVSRKHFNERFTTVKLIGHGGLEKVTNRDAKPFVQGLKLKHVTSLDMSLDPRLPKKDRKVAACVPRLLSQLMPNLKEIDFSNTDLAQSALVDVARNCPKIEKITSHNGIATSFVVGQDLRLCHLLKELYMDNTTFYVGDALQEMWIFEQEDNAICLFCHCIGNLEKVSIRGAQSYVFQQKPKPYTQLGLMKFARMAPKLSWFRSDLTAENIAILKRERPGVTFV